MPRAPLLAGLTAVAIIALDRVTKLWIVEWLDLQSRLVIDVWPPFLRFVMAWNRGVNFGLFGSDNDTTRWVLIAVAVAISAALTVWAFRAEGVRVPLCLGLVIGGALGNVWDRLTYGAVADFLNMSCCGIDNPYAFNVADIAIFAGALGLVLWAGEPKAKAG